MDVLGLDVGGANLKVMHTAGRACTHPFALWKAPQRLIEELKTLLAGCPSFDRLALTMTGELCDCFESKRQGINHILDAVEAVAGGVPVSVWTNSGTFVTLAEARKKPLPAASANWLALATVAGRFAPPGPALLIDVGTTTTDVIPLLDGRPVPAGRTDSERFASGELVYVGWRRTPLCAFTGVSRAAELYATTLDAYLLLRVVDEKPNDLDTADGRPATRAAANRRLSRMLGGDLETITQRECDELAREINFKVAGQISMAAERVCKRLPGPVRAIIASGSGECLVRGLKAFTLFPPTTKDCQLISLTKELGDAGSAAACAYAVAVLCQEMTGP
jgi:(4-(4-[2-(gamma-L-glutamylamino)ethyl]phenoxymethyl)furan-2-yl)methanamine synthase